MFSHNLQNIFWIRSCAALEREIAYCHRSIIVMYIHLDLLFLFWSMWFGHFYWFLKIILFFYLLFLFSFYSNALGTFHKRILTTRNELGVCESREYWHRSVIGHSTTEAFWNIKAAFDNGIFEIRTIQKWFQTFCSGDYIFEISQDENYDRLSDKIIWMLWLIKIRELPSENVHQNQNILHNCFPALESNWKIKETG